MNPRIEKVRSVVRWIPAIEDVTYNQMPNAEGRMPDHSLNAEGRMPDHSLNAEGRMPDHSLNAQREMQDSIVAIANAALQILERT